MCMGVWVREGGRGREEDAWGEGGKVDGWVWMTTVAGHALTPG